MEKKPCSEMYDYVSLSTTLFEMGLSWSQLNRFADRIYEMWEKSYDMTDTELALKIISKYKIKPKN